ncbi:conserved exported hypothetical protein [Candidatus Terasakiella magnetica]|nr:conserved exported hypothetical protein [Candidatus Terasakiella magnetica]
MSRLSVFWFLALVVLGLTACASVDTDANALAIARTARWGKTVLGTTPYRLALFGPAQPRADNGVLTVYIEGDGLAWLDTAMPSPDPTPRNAVALKMAVADGRSSVVYLARPCQFLLQRDWTRCDVEDWTSGRFSAAIISSFEQALDQLKARSGATALELVGYSGGGVVATLLAERRSDVARLVTVAAPLDVGAWIKHHDVSPLKGSLDPVQGADRLKPLPQVHITGRKDKVVPAAIVESFVRREGKDAPVKRMEADASHECCWDEKWPALRRQMGDAPHP